MGYSKADLELHIKNTKRIIKLLKELQKLCWSNSDCLPVWKLIDVENKNLCYYKDKLTELDENKAYEW